MKQYITPEQLNELSEEQKERLREWWRPKKGDFVLLDYNVEVYLVIGTSDRPAVNDSSRWLVRIENNAGISNKSCLPLLSIGQMIELLQENIKDFWIRYFDKHVDFTVTVGWDLNKPKDTHTDDELCDALWQAVKEVL